MRIVSDISVGYCHPAYVESLRHLGEPVRLNACGGWVLRRLIPDTELYDCIGPYPLFMCRDWARLPEDLTALRDSLAVSVVIVPDPFGGWTPAFLESVFDVVNVVKRRWIVDLGTDFERLISEHHRHRAARALTRIQIERCDDPRQHAGDWTRCYQALIAERRITGAAAFPPRCLVEQLSISDLLMYRASARGDTLGFSLWMVHGTSAYNHLTAYTTDARRRGAAYALYWVILRDLQTRGVERADLGGGVEDDDGLARWKAGWTPESRPSLVCGAILRPAEYGELTRARGVVNTSYFPGYRTPEDR